MDRRPVGRVAAGISLVAVLAATLVTLSLAGVLKARCATGQWSDGRQYRQLCYSDVVPLYGTEHLSGGRLPYLDPCPPTSGTQCDEYPVLTMYLMRAAAWAGRGYGPFFAANAVALAVCALVTAWALYAIGGRRALYFAAAPTLLVYAFVNWDLLAVVLAALATLAFVRGRDRTAGALLGLGAAAKLYPALLVVPFALQRHREGRSGAAVGIAVWAAVAFAVVNVPFALLAPSPWSTFFRFNAARAADWDSLWFVACQRRHGGTSCAWSPRLLNGLSLALLVVLAVGTWWARRARDRNFPRWTFAFPLLVLFLLTNKVYSPQYSLWLLPWFGLALPNPWLFGAFEAADVAVFVTRFWWFGRLSAQFGDRALAGFHGVPIGGFEVAVVARALVLVVCLGAWVLAGRRAPPDRAVVPGEPSLAEAET